MRHATVTGRLFEPIGWALGRLLAVLEAGAFWAAATFPVLHAPAGLLYVRESISTSVLVGLALLHAIAIVVGHRYNCEGVAADA
ncbi:hypothetical protein BRC85_04385 [Halobacteriales archaeon QS_1_69_70]|nr:MAG: hypothetical protein BRC85_04385 [Halobacteriales archaeon QS_1_69_70]